MPKNGIPDRWEYYAPFGKAIGETRFVAFKVPLKESLCRKLPSRMRFTPSDLIASVDKLGIVVDLTNTCRYYDSPEITDRGVDYVKISCRGGGAVPDRDVVDKFFETVEDFLRKNDRSLIGVHCTHGVNRTGYLICKYMIDKLKYDPEDAVREFNNARGHRIEREEYVKHLYGQSNVEEEIEADGKNSERKSRSSKSNGWNSGWKFNGRNSYTRSRTDYEANSRESGSRDNYPENSRQSDCFNFRGRNFYRRQTKNSHYDDYWCRPAWSNDEYNYARNTDASRRQDPFRSRSFDGFRTYPRSHVRFDEDSDCYRPFDNFDTSQPLPLAQKTYYY